MSTQTYRLSISGVHKKNTAAAWSPDSKFLVTADKERVCVWNMETKASVKTHEKLVANVKNHGHPAAWSPKGDTIALADPKVGVVLLDAKFYTIKHVLKHKKCVSVAWSQSGEYLASAGYDKYVRIWDPIAGRELAMVKHSSKIYDVAFSPSRNIIASGSKDGIRVFDVNGAIIQDIPSRQTIKNITWKDSAHLVFATDVKNFGVVNVEAYSVEWQKSQEEPIYSIDSKEKVIALGCNDGIVKIVDAFNGTPIKIYQVLKKNVVCVRFNPTGSFIAVCNNKGEVRVIAYSE